MFPSVANHTRKRLHCGFNTTTSYHNTDIRRNDDVCWEYANYRFSYKVEQLLKKKKHVGMSLNTKCHNMHCTRATYVSA